MSDGVKYIIVLIPFGLTMAAFMAVAFMRPYKRFQWLAMVCVAVAFSVEMYFNIIIGFGAIDPNLRYVGVMFGSLCTALASTAGVIAIAMRSEYGWQREDKARKKER